MSPLRRLLTHRGTDAATLAQAADVPLPELDAVLDGGPADAELVRRVAPVLGLRTADAFVVVGSAVPADVAAASDTRIRVDQLLRAALHLRDEDLDRMHDLIRSLPPRAPAGPLPAPVTDGPGPLVGGLFANRNIRPYVARLLCEIGDGPYVSPVTVHQVVQGRLEMTARYVTAFAALCGIDADDLAALTGVGPPARNARLHPHSGRLAELAWDARRLDGEQLARVLHAADDLRRYRAGMHCCPRDAAEQADRRG
ncbi:hypothetical protein AB0G04_26470 [Actinoplanes sp. NPDC023801]|uniref:hypothetical protein n=1 Tax=Actinoplanes sp. NPDC023801 TaxID=3154595 RepID=UPI00340809E3